ncbi:MAG: hypothetical protein PUE68_12430, partial [Kiritimatiellae bacterium]|nr:hypothetical protein [Kiritimatiellia bacterium]
LRAELEVVYEAPENPSANRHVYGVGEKVKFRLQPALSDAVIRTESFDARGEQLSYNNTFDGAYRVSGAGERIYTAPFTATHPSPVTISLNGVEYIPSMTFVEPAYVECRGAARNPYTPCLPPGEVGGMMLLTTNYVGPMHVSFQGIALAEIPCGNRIPPDGYFSTTNFQGELSHTIRAGAGRTRKVSTNNFWYVDMAGRGTNYQNWSSGHMVWKIPIGWIRMVHGVATDLVIDEPEYEEQGKSWTRRLLIGGEDAYSQEFSIDGDGTAKIWKYGHWLSRSRDCQIRLDGNVIQEEHQ